MQHNTAPNAPYTRRPPSPPEIYIPAVFHPRKVGNVAQLVMTPSYDNVDPSQLTLEDLAIITQNESHLIAQNIACNWKYEQRREAQRILDFLYLGPNSVIRNHAFLEQEKITMILIVRDSRLASQNFVSVNNAVKALGVEAQYMDVASPQDLIHSFSGAVSRINDHLLSVYHKQAQGREANGQMLLDTSEFVRGKVLVTCESGNDLSSTVVAAYIMAVFGKDFASAIQFVSIQRFCTLFGEDVKRLLQSWGDILQARATVARDRTGAQVHPASKGKRGLEALHDENMEGSDDGSTADMDQDRFLGRSTFAPFVDIPETERASGQNFASGPMG